MEKYFLYSTDFIIIHLLYIIIFLFFFIHKNTLIIFLLFNIDNCLLIHFFFKEL